MQAVTEAAEKISDRLEKGWSAHYAEHFDMGAGGDMTAGIDKMAESIYVDYLEKFGTIDSEESGIIGTGDARIILDPIDGSDNALSGLPYFGSSIALERDGRVEEAVVVNLANGDLFYKSGGPLMWGKLKKIDFTPVVRREKSTVGIFEKAYAYPALAELLLEKRMKFRSPGAVALSLAYAHYVKFVIFAGRRRRYDFAAALWMCEGLHKVETENLLIVAKDREVAEFLQLLVLQDEG